MNRIILLFAVGILIFGFQSIFGQKRNLSCKSKPIIISCGVCNQKAIFLPNPKYSEAAKFVRASGKVSVQILIDEKGNVVKAKINSGHPLLRASSIKAALRAKFEPFLLSGNPVRVNGTIVYNNSLDSTIQPNQNEFTVYAIKLPRPPFPSACNAKFAINEEVTVEVEISEKGNVILATALSGHPCLKAAALSAARFSKFEEPKILGVPTKAKTQIIYTFFYYRRKNRRFCIS